MIQPHADAPPDEIIKALDDRQTYLHLYEKLLSKELAEDVVFFAVLGNTTRDAYFYHYLLCSMIEHCSQLPRIITVTDDLKQPAQFDYVAHEQWRLTDVRDRLPESLAKYGENPFFYRIAALLILNELEVSFSQLLVCDNDILFFNDLSHIFSRNVFCRYNEHKDSDLMVRILTQDYGTLPLDYYRERRGPYSDFLFALRNTIENQQFLRRICIETKAPTIPETSYYYWWLNWVRFINLRGPNNFLPLIPQFHGSKVYCLDNNPLFYHVGGGYERKKAGLFAQEVLRHPSILQHSRIDTRLLEMYVASLSLPEDKETWVDVLIPEDYRKRE